MWKTRKVQISLQFCIVLLLSLSRRQHISLLGNPFKVNGYTFRGSYSFLSFLLPISLGSSLKEKEFSPLREGEQILFFKSRPYFERAALSRKANRKSQKLFPFAKMIEI